MNKKKELEKIADEIAACPLCKKGGTGKAVPGEGDPDARVMFIGEAPGRSEAEIGMPFVGKSGKFLRRMIHKIGLEDSDIFITSPVHYLPVRGAPATFMVRHGVTHLMKQIAVIQPRIIVLLGKTACRAVLSKNVEIAKEHGKTIRKNGMTFFISVHPAYADRFPEGREKFIQDFTVLKSLLARRRI